jgi:hypothetical protein
LIKEIDKRIKSVPWVVKEERPEKLHVAKISFAFNNGELLRLLDQRGNLISSGKLDKLKDVNQKLK